MAEREKNFKEHKKVLRQNIQDLTAKVARLEEEAEEEILRWKVEKQEMMDRHAVDLDESAIDSKTSAVVSVFQAQSELARKDPATWDVAGWKDALFRLTGVHPDHETGDENPAKENPAKEEEATSKEVHVMMFLETILFFVVN